MDDISQYQLLSGTLYDYLSYYGYYQETSTGTSGHQEEPEDSSPGSTRSVRKRKTDDPDVTQLFKKLATDIHMIGKVVSKSVSKENFDKYCRDTDEKIVHLDQTVVTLQSQVVEKDKVIEKMSSEQKQFESTIEDMRADLINLSLQIDALETKQSGVNRWCEQSEAFQIAMSKLQQIFRDKDLET